MGAFAETTSLVQKYPLTFLAAAALAAVAFPVVTVSMASPLRPWAKRILRSALAARGELQRIAAESKEAYADLYAEVEGEALREERPVERPAAPAAQRFSRVEPAPQADAAAPAA